MSVMEMNSGRFGAAIEVKVELKKLKNTGVLVPKKGGNTRLS